MGVHGHSLDSQSKMKSSNSNLRGQLGTRSSPLSPTSSKLTTQYLVLDHMTNHYNKITKAKPAIDNKPPKSMQTSQKARDRKLRDYVAKTGMRPASGMSKGRPRPHTSYDQYDDIYDERLWGDPSDEEEKMIHDIMRTTLKGQDAGMFQTNYDTHQNYPRPVQEPGPSGYSLQHRPGSARSLRSGGSAAAMRTVIQASGKKGTYDGDVLDKHSQVFTEEKPFTPRTLKTDRVSRLSQYKYYNKPPPKAKKTSPPPQQSEVTSDMKPKESDAPPKPKPRNRKFNDTQEGMVTDNSLMFETLHTRDYSKFESNRDERVPRLDISLDTDHMNWIKDQASKAQLRTKSGTLKSSIREDEAYDTTIDFGKTGEMSLTYGTLGSTKARPVDPRGMRSSRLSEEDEEAKYTKFMKDITDEVLNRGIYTDRALRVVFKSHIARKKGDLDELRMHQCCDQIRTELNIPRYDIKDDTTYTHGESEPTHHHHISDLNYHAHTSLEPSSQGRGHLDIAAMNGALDTSMKSKASSGHLDSRDNSHIESHDTYNFKSTGSEDMFSTIRTDGNATLGDTQALQEYQQTISQQDTIVVREDSESEGEIRFQQPVQAPKPAERIQKPLHQEAAVAKPVKAVIHGEPVHHEYKKSNPVKGRTHQNKEHKPVEVEDQQGRDAVKTDDKHVEKHRAPTPTSQVQSELDDYEDDYDSYDDDGDDEGYDHQNTEPTATYRTDDDDF